MLSQFDCVKMGGKIKRANAGDIMISPVITSDVNESIENICKVMAEKGVGSIIITENDIPVGIITERKRCNVLSPIFRNTINRY